MGALAPVLVLSMVLGFAGPAAAAPEGQMTWAVHVTLAPTWFDPAETPGVITMLVHSLVVVFNATPYEVAQVVPSLRGGDVALHPVQANGSDPVVRASTFDPATGTLTVPGRTVAVFLVS